MSEESYFTLQKIYKIFDNINFDECYDCVNKCCHSPWFLKEEQEVGKHLLEEKGIKDVSISFFGSSDGCKHAVNNRCQIYDRRPLDCRLFPLDLVEEHGEYWWAIFQNCSRYEEISKKLIPLIPKIESLFDQNIFKQYQRQIAITFETYKPYRLRKYKKIAKYKNKNNVL
jgi:Fe-S-cluster containining protein